MINKRFQEDWLKMLNLNYEINHSENPEIINKTLKIPFTHLEVDGYLLYFLFEYLYPKFINDQKNVVDIIISDYDIDNITTDAYLYKTSRLGIYDSIVKLPTKSITIKQSDMKHLDDLFIKVQSTLLTTNNIRIASIRFFRRRTIDLINRYYEEMEKYSNLEYLQHLIDLIQKLIKENLIVIYPEPNLVQFLKNIFLLIGDLKFSNFFNLFFEILPNFNQTIVFHSNNLIFTLNTQKIARKQNKPELLLTLKRSDNENFPMDFDLNKEELSQIRKVFKSDNVLSLRFEPLINYMLELSELRIPLEKKRIELLLQKLLYAVKSLGIHWNIIPRPKIYNTIFRFLIRLIGFNLNPMKISYWAIPGFISNMVDTYLGLNYRITLIIADKEKPLSIMMLGFQDSSLIEIKSIQQKEIIVTENISTLSSAWNNINIKYGFNVLIVKIDIKIIEKIFETFVFRLNKLNIFTLYSLMRMLKQSKYLEIYPELPPFQLIKKKNSFSLIKLLLNVLIDKYEF